MTNTNTVHPKAVRDHDGEFICLIPMDPEGQDVIRLFPDDLDRIIDNGFTQWDYYPDRDRESAVMVRKPGNDTPRTAAQQVAAVRKGSIIHFIDGDPRNLRRDNLKVSYVPEKGRPSFKFDEWPGPKPRVKPEPFRAPGVSPEVPRVRTAEGASRDIGQCPRTLEAAGGPPRGDVTLAKRGRGRPRKVQPPAQPIPPVDLRKA